MDVAGVEQARVAQAVARRVALPQAVDAPVAADVVAAAVRPHPHVA